MRIGILCSGVALGVYIPGLYVNKGLKSRGIFTRVFVLENLFTDDKKSKIEKNKTAFHENFRVALIGQKIAGDIDASVDPVRKKRLFEQWNTQRIDSFIVLSGFWLTLIEEYAALHPGGRFSTECLHIDTTISASWRKAYAKISGTAAYNDGWLYDFSKKAMLADIFYTSDQPVPFAARPDRLLVHGGGWGMGTYRTKIPELESRGIGLDIVVYSQDEIFGGRSNRFFMTQPGWSPMDRGRGGEYEFPPFSQIIEGQAPVYRSNGDFHRVLELSREVKGIVSKPGGATLLDSFAAATPMIFLEPFGEYERHNSELFIENGFGISFDDFKSGSFDFAVLEKLHKNLLNARKEMPDYVSSYLERNGENQSCSRKPM